MSANLVKRFIDDMFYSKKMTRVETNLFPTTLEDEVLVKDGLPYGVIVGKIVGKERIGVFHEGLTDFEEYEWIQSGDKIGFKWEKIEITGVQENTTAENSDVINRLLELEAKITDLNYLICKNSPSTSNS